MNKVQKIQYLESLKSDTREERSKIFQDLEKCLLITRQAIDPEIHTGDLLLIFTLFGKNKKGMIKFRDCQVTINSLTGLVTLNYTKDKKLSSRLRQSQYVFEDTIMVEDNKTMKLAKLLGKFIEQVDRLANSNYEEKPWKYIHFNYFNEKIKDGRRVIKLLAEDKLRKIYREVYGEELFKIKD